MLKEKMLIQKKTVHELRKEIEIAGFLIPLPRETKYN